MTQPGSHRLLFAALLVWILVFAGAAMTVRQWPALGERARRRQSEMTALRALETDWNRATAMERQLRDRFGAPASNPPPDVALALFAPRLFEPSSTPPTTPPGWTLTRLGLDLDDAPIGALLARVRGIETGSPAWRVAEMRIQSSSIKPGHGQVSLVFERLMPAAP